MILLLVNKDSVPHFALLILSTFYFFIILCTIHLKIGFSFLLYIKNKTFDKEYFVIAIRIRRLRSSLKLHLLL